MSERVQEKIESWEVLDILSGLVEKNLVLVETDDNETRYRMLETVRQYSREHLFESEHGKEVRDRHVVFFCEFLEKYRIIRGRDRLERLAMLEADFDNIRAALEWSTESPDENQYAFRMCYGLLHYWNTGESVREGFDRCRAALAALPLDPTLNRARCLNVAGGCARAIGEIALSLTFFEQALEITQNLGERADEAAILNNIGFSKNVQGKTDEAEPYLLKALEIWKELGEAVRVGVAYNNLGDCYRIRGDAAGARQFYERSLENAKEAKDDYSVAINYLNLGDTAVLEKQYPTALDFYQKCMAQTRHAKTPILEAYAKIGASSVLVDQQHASDAAQQLAEAIHVLMRLGAPAMVIGAYPRVAILATHLGVAATAILLLAAKAELDPMPIRPIEPPLPGDPLQEARAMVDAETFESLWEEGRGLSYDRSVQVALGFLTSAQER